MGVLLSAHVDPDLAQALRTRAAQSDRSVSAEIRVALRAHLNDETPAGTQGFRHNPGAGTARSDAG